MSRQINASNTTERDQLIEILRASTLSAIESIISMAHATKRLTEMGVDVTDLGLGISGGRRDALINIANENLSPQVYQSLGHRPQLLRLVCTLPKEEQNQWAKGIPVRVYLSHVDDDYLLVRPDQLSRDQAKQVFAESGGLRTRAGQLEWIAANSNRAKKIPPEVSEVLYGKGFVEFTSPTTKTLSELLEIVTRLTEKRK
jgi:hypothetical protein